MTRRRHRDAPKMPEAEWKALLARIPELRGKLSAAAEKLNQTIVTVENTLAGLRLGVQASVSMSADEGGRARVLSYVKDDRVWLLMVERPAQGKRPADAEALTSETLATRMTAIQHLPMLLDALLKKAETEAAKVTTKTEALHAFIRNTQKLNGPDELARKIDKVSHELFKLLEENGLDMDKNEDLVLIQNVLARHFLKP